MMIDATHQSARSGSRRSCPSVATSCCGVGWNRRDKTAPFRPGRSLRPRTTLAPFILTSVHILPPSNSPGLANAPTTCQLCTSHHHHLALLSHLSFSRHLRKAIGGWTGAQASVSTSQIANVKVQAVRLANFASSCSPWALGAVACRCICTDNRSIAAHAAVSAELGSGLGDRGSKLQSPIRTWTANIPPMYSGPDQHIAQCLAYLLRGTQE